MRRRSSNGSRMSRSVHQSAVCSNHRPMRTTTRRRLSVLVGLLLATCVLGAPALAASRIPTLTKAQAEGHLMDALHDHFGNGFNQSADRRTACRRISRLRFRCHPSWGDTYGTASIWHGRGSEGFPGTTRGAFSFPTAASTSSSRRSWRCTFPNPFCWPCCSGGSGRRRRNADRGRR